MSGGEKKVSIIYGFTYNRSSVHEKVDDNILKSSCTATFSSLKDQRYVGSSELVASAKTVCPIAKHGTAGCITRFTSTVRHATSVKWPFESFPIGVCPELLW